MNVIFEGLDACGKTTQIKLLETEFAKRGKVSHVLHYSNINLDSNEKIRIASQLRYREMFNILNLSSDLNNFILDRAHLGEAVYAPIYREYNGDFVFDYEQQFLVKEHQLTKLIVFLDDAEKIIERDKQRGDGLSFSLDYDKKVQEIKAFERAFELSSLDKICIYLQGRTPEQIFEQVKAFVFKGN